MKWLILSLIIIGSAGSIACGASDSTKTVCPSDLRVVFSPTDTTISVGQHFSASLAVLYCGGAAVRRDTATWKSLDTSVVTVDLATGFVTAVGTGKTVLLAMTQDGSFEGSTIVVR